MPAQHAECRAIDPKTLDSGPLDRWPTSPVLEELTARDTRARLVSMDEDELR